MYYLHEQKQKTVTFDLTRSRYCTRYLVPPLLLSCWLATEGLFSKWFITEIVHVRQFFLKKKKSFSLIHLPSFRRFSGWGCSDGIPKKLTQTSLTTRHRLQLLLGNPKTFPRSYLISRSWVFPGSLSCGWYRPDRSSVEADHQGILVKATLNLSAHFRGATPLLACRVPLPIYGR